MPSCWAPRTARAPAWRAAPASLATPSVEPTASPWLTAAAPATVSTTRCGLGAGGPGSLGTEPAPGENRLPSRPLCLQLGHSFVTADCSQRCTCASSGVLLCEPFSCRPGEICTLGNLTRGCFRGEPGPLSSNSATSHPVAPSYPQTQGPLSYLPGPLQPSPQHLHLMTDQENGS